MHPILKVGNKMSGMMRLKISGKIPRKIQGLRNNQNLKDKKRGKKEDGSEKEREGR